MTPNEKTIANFETRIRQLILRFQEMKKENQDLYETIEKSEKDIAELRAKLEQQQNDYQSLKMAKMIEITDGDLSGAKDRLAKLIREVNKCIAILTDEKEYGEQAMAEQKKDRLHIRLHVYDEEIDVVINREEEEFYRAAAKLITERYNAYAQAYKGRKSEHTVADRKSVV